MCAGGKKRALIKSREQSCHTSPDKRKIDCELFILQWSQEYNKRIKIDN